MFRKTGLLVPLLLTLLAACSQTSTPETGETAELVPMFGTSASDSARDLANHNLGVYVVGHTLGNLHGTNRGKSDTFVRKEDQYGRLLWSRQFGTSTWDQATDVASDSNNNAYVLGTTEGNIAGRYGEADIFLRKYDPDGNTVWTRQFGNNGTDRASGVAVDSSGNTYVAAMVNGSPRLYKYGLNGNLMWRQHFDTSESVILYDVAVDSDGNTYVAGSKNSSTTDKDMFIRKFSPSGGVLWSQQVHYSNRDEATAVAVSGSSVYLVGNYLWNNDYADSNVAVTKFTTGGTQLWSNAYGAYGYDGVSDASVDSYGYLYFSGGTQTSFAGPNQGGMDGYVMKVSYTGYWPPLWSKTIGTPAFDLGYAVVARPLGTRTCAIAISDLCNQIYLAGQVGGRFPYFDYRGSDDAFLRRLYSADGGTVWTK